MHPEELIKKIGIALSLGGDGTLLNTARFFYKKFNSILGINFGRFGFPDRYCSSESGRYSYHGRKRQF
ncbi:MAG: NAD(+)/NADH kinase [bacterium]|nr:NAD(+)/NADH kinase [bacterium]